jgi:hypothetical protein
MKSSHAYFCLGLIAVAFAAAAGSAQMPAYTGSGPVPPAIPAAKTIFVSNTGADSGLFPEPFSGDQDRAYSEFYAALKANGAYTLVSDPGQADLVLELRLSYSYGPSNPSRLSGAGGPLPQFELVVYDRKTHYILWTFTQLIDMALLQKNQDRDFEQALSAVLARFLQIAGKAPGMPHS